MPKNINMSRFARTLHKIIYTHAFTNICNMQGNLLACRNTTVHRERCVPFYVRPFRPHCYFAYLKLGKLFLNRNTTTLGEFKMG